MSDQKKPKLQPVKNAAAYPTLREVGLTRRTFLLGAGLAAVGAACLPLSGDPAVEPDFQDASGISAPPQDAGPLSGGPDVQAPGFPDAEVPSALDAGVADDAGK